MGLIKKFIAGFMFWAGLTVLAAAAFAVLTLFALRYVDPPTSCVQLQRRAEAMVHGTQYRPRYTFVKLDHISLAMQHAVIAAEDARFYQHEGVDWTEVQKAMDKDLEEGRPQRGASTITQQLVKNIFMTTHRSYMRKGIEFLLTPLCEKILGKDRILELYLNVIEWGPGVYGAEEASQFWFQTPAKDITREQGAKLASVLPAPRTREPAHMKKYTAAILRRMTQMGW